MSHVALCGMAELIRMLCCLSLSVLSTKESQGYLSADLAMPSTGFKAWIGWASVEGPAGPTAGPSGSRRPRRAWSTAVSAWFIGAQ